MSLRLSCVILPTRRWHELRGLWRRAEELGFHTGYTYDHLLWEPLRDRPWLGAVPTLTGAACVTERLRLGTLVTSPNFRHPLPLAREVMTLDDISGGRVTLGVGAGWTGHDAVVLGRPACSVRERADRFAEFVALLDQALSAGGDAEAVSSYEGRCFTARETSMLPGCVQRPRPPFAVAALGARGMRVAARYGQAWVTAGAPELFGTTGSPAVARRALRRQRDALHAACERVGRDAAGIDKILLTGLTADRPLASFDAFVDLAGVHAEMGFTEIVLHWPTAESWFDADEKLIERVATEGLAQLA
ncbi:LLM class flavin-dependent oxidoreductase [Streptomyces sp. NPDC039022]|uniref:LLM class flavin-dependent oxidoreductase n=1 Tax=Streptomyces sp. NPDC039022 TaxID=3157091 RepID=UPI0033DE861D